MPAKHSQQIWPRLQQPNRQPKGGADDGRAPSVLFTGPVPAITGRQGFSSDMSDELVPVEIDGVFTPTPPQLAGLLAYLESIQD